MVMPKYLGFGPRYQKMNASERSNYRKELKFRLIALVCIYAGFTAWWLMMSHLSD